MKTTHVRSTLGVFALLLLASAINASAEVSVRITAGHGHQRAHYAPYRPVPVYYAPRRFYPYYVHRPHFYRSVVVAPVVVPQPVYVEPPVVNSAVSGNYGQDLAALRERLNRLRSVVEKQKDKGGIPHASYDRFASTLDGIEHDLQVRAYDRNGTLRPEDFADFSRRLDQANEDVQIALAE